MKNSMKVIGIVLILTALAFTACDTSTSSGGGGGGGSTPQQSGNTLIIQNLPIAVYNYALAGGQLGIYPTGTTPQQAYSATGLVAGNDNLLGTDITVIGSGPYSLLIPIYTLNAAGVRWNGRGTFDVYVILYGGGGHYYKGSSINFSSATTTVDFDIDAEEVFLP